MAKTKRTAGKSITILQQIGGIVGGGVVVIIFLQFISRPDQVTISEVFSESKTTVPEVVMKLDDTKTEADTLD